MAVPPGERRDWPDVEDAPCTTFSPRLPPHFSKILAAKDIKSAIHRKKRKANMFKMRDQWMITNSNRRNVWLNVSGGTDQIKHHNACEIFEWKSLSLSPHLTEFWRGVDLMEHDCFGFSKRNFCCLNTFNSSVEISSGCHNPLCGASKPHSGTYKFSACCAFYLHSKWIADLAATCDPSSNRTPLLFCLSNMFTLLFNEDYEIFACLVGVLRNEDRTFLDTTLVRARISAAVLRWFLRDLCRLLFRSAEIAHPWLRTLFELEPHKLKAPFCDSSKNPWLFCDWQLFLFQCLNTESLLGLVDLYLVCGVRELYRSILYYFCVFFFKLNTKSVSVFQKFDLTVLLSLLKSVLTDQDASPHARSLSAVRRLKVTNKTIKAYSAKLLPTVISLGSEKEEASSLDIMTRESSSKEWPSSVITASEWVGLLSWLPVHVQLLSPALSYSSNIHGWSLQTLYHKNEENEPVLLVIKTECSSIFGGFIPQSLKTRNKLVDCALSFGTGEAFVFSIRPTMQKYSWVSLCSSPTSTEKNSHSNIKSIPSLSHPHLSELKSKRTLMQLMSIKKNFRKSKHVTLEDTELVVLHDVPYSMELMCLNEPRSQPPASPDESQANAPNDIFVVADDDSLALGGGGGYAIFLDKTLTNGTSQRCATFINEPFVPHSHGCFKSLVVEVFRFVDTSLC